MIEWLNLQNALGPDGRLGVSARLYTAQGDLREEVSFNAGQRFPMASTAKIAVAMVAASRIAAGDISLDEQIRVSPNVLAPGLARSPLDRLFYVPFEVRRTETIGRLLR